jgi:hypothetical protein
MNGTKREPDEMILLPYSVYKGKKWFWDIHRFSAQCAYCLFIQSMKSVRESDEPCSLVIGLLIIEESHSDLCPQKGTS